MAEYENLTSLEGLQAGDIITYDGLDDFVINVDPKGYTFKVDLYGGQMGSSSLNLGGYTTAIINSSNYSDIITLAAYRRSMHISYGSFSSYASLLYYRFLVSGAAGQRAGGAIGGKGGGSSGSAGYYSVGSATQTLARGGAQTSGGSGYGGGGAGSFGYGGYSGSVISTQKGTEYGGAGWYGGGSWYYNASGNTKGAGGGSGFIIGQTTNTFPSGYMGSNTETINILKGSISEASTTQGGATLTPRIVITIISGGAAQPKFSYYKDGEFKSCEGYYYNGTEFVKVEPLFYSNGEFK